MLLDVYLTGLTVRNAKLLRHVELVFAREDGTPRSWTVLVGENGLCKTTLLHAIALAASGPTRANQLIPDAVALRDRRHQDDPVVFSANFAFSPTFHAAREYPGLAPKPAVPPALLSTLTLEPGRKEFEGVSSYPDVARPPSNGDPLTTSRARDLPLWFVAGYGVTRTLRAVTMPAAPAVLALARLEPLFGASDFIGTAFAELLEPELARHYVRVLRDVLVGGGLLPDVTDIELRGRGGIRSAADLVQAHRFTQRVGPDDVKLPATWLSHGYQSTIAWVADLVGQVLLEANGTTPGRSPSDLVLVEAAEMEGLVLIDEIDLHLHPRWQVRLIPALKRVFPKLQFVATTHSPMVLPGLERDEVLVLRQDARGDVVARNFDQAPALMTGSEIYETFFGLDRLYPDQLGEDLRRYGYLAGDPARTDEEERELQALRERLRRADVDPGWEPVGRDAAPGPGNGSGSPAPRS